jgi:hypothetical protein
VSTAPTERVASGLIGVLIIKVVVIRPLLNQRTDAVLAGVDDGGSALHLFYIAADGLLIVGLVTALVFGVRRWVSDPPGRGWGSRRRLSPTPVSSTRPDRPRGPSMTSTGVSKTRESTSPVMISSGVPNSTTAPFFDRADVVGVVAGEVDVVEDDDDGPSHLDGGPTQVLHHLHRMLHVEVVQRLVEQHVVGVLGEHHRDIRALPLTAGELVDEPAPRGR